MVIHLRDFNAPTVFYTHGYASRIALSTYLDMAEMIGANVVALEHRQFGTSRFEDDRWDYLTVEQSAEDLHKVYTAMKRIFPKKWLSTGTSKDGMTSIFYKKLHPEDMDVATSFCSPFNLSLTDLRVGTYMMNESGSKEDNTKMRNVLRALADSNVLKIYNDYRAQMQQPPLDYRIYMFRCFETFFFLHSYYDDTYKYFTYPPLPLNSEYICKWLDWACDINNGKKFQNLYNTWLKIYGIAGQRTAPKTDDLVPFLKDFESSYAYSVQCAKQLGGYAHDISVIKDLVPEGFTIEDPQNPCALMDDDLWLYSIYSNAFIQGVLDYLAVTNDPILMVYSKNDPWTGARPAKTGPGIKTIINPLGIHNHDFYNKKHYDDASFFAIRDFIGQYFKIVNGTRQPQVKMRSLTAEEAEL